MLGRLLAVYFMVAVWGALLLGRLVDLQAFRSEDFRAQAEAQRAGYAIFSARRGDILDRTLDTLAIDVHTDLLAADPLVAKERAAETARLLAKPLDRPAEEIFQKLHSDGRFVLLERMLLPAQSQRIRALHTPGVFIRDGTRRFYPTALASQVLGFVSPDNKGLNGLEYLYDERIRGEDSRVNLVFDARRQSYQRDATDLRTSGDTLVLNLDHSLQFVAEEVLAKTIEKSRAGDGSVVVMDPETGEILAMASHPAFNPNQYSRYGGEAFRNRAILDTYEPGSTFKIITMAAVLNEGLAELSERIDCRVGTLNLAGKVYREATHSYGELSVAEVLAKSSNVGTIKLALRLGQQRLYEYIRRFGFGEKTGVDLPGEQVGLLRQLSQWSKISIGAHAIGQEIGVTPLQMARAVSVVANGGFLVEPHIVRQIHDPDGELKEEFPPRRSRILETETTRLLKKALTQVVETGTGKGARLNGYSSAGKTGTAQKFIDGRYSDTKYVASYVGFAPVDQPRLVVTVVVNEPRNGYYGGDVAAPAFKEIMERSLIHLNVPRDRPAPAAELASAGPRPGAEPKPAAGVSAVEERLPQASLEQTVLTLMDEAPENGRAGGLATLETGRLRVPDFTGLSLREVAKQCARLGLTLKVSGSGVAVGQRPPVGKAVGRGAVCEVYFSSRGERAVASDEVARDGAASFRDLGNRRNHEP